MISVLPEFVISSMLLCWHFIVYNYCIIIFFYYSKIKSDTPTFFPDFMILSLYFSSSDFSFY